MLGRMIGASCVLLALWTPAVADDHGEPAAEQPGLLLSGSLDLSAGYVSMDPGPDIETDFPNDTARVSGEARVSLPLFSGFSLQLDLAGEADLNNDYGDDNSIDDYERLVQAGAHLSYRSAENYLIGIFGSAGGVQTLHEDTETGWMGGLEAQYFLGNTTLYGQAGFFDSSAIDSETLIDARFGRAVIRHFIDPNMSVSAEFLYGRGSDNAIDTKYIDFASWGLAGEKRLEDYPLSLSLSYEGNYIGNTVNDDPIYGDDERLVEHVFMAGISYKFGSTTLLEEDRYGATLDLPTAPLRAAGYTLDVVD